MGRGNDFPGYEAHVVRGKNMLLGVSKTQTRFYGNEAEGCADPKYTLSPPSNVFFGMRYLFWYI